MLYRWWQETGDKSVRRYVVDDADERLRLLLMLSRRCTQRMERHTVGVLPRRRRMIGPKHSNMSNLGPSLGSQPADSPSLSCAAGVNAPLVRSLDVLTTLAPQGRRV